MPTPFEYAQLALRVYQNDDANRISIPDGWIEAIYFPNDALTGFSGGIYYKAATNEVVVSYTGTDFASVDWVSNFGLGAGLPEGQISRTVALYQAAKQQFPGASITFTGHSLGGGLASIMSVFFAKSAAVYAEAPFEAGARHGVNVDDIPQAFLAARVAVLARNQLTPLYRTARLLAQAGIVDTDFNAHFGDPSNAVFRQREAAVQNSYVAGEVLQPLRAIWPTIVNSSTEKSLPVGQSTIDFLSKHSMALHLAVVEDSQFRQAVNALPTLLAEIAAMKNPGFATKDLMMHLLLHQYGVRQQTGAGIGATVTEVRAPDFMLDRIGADLLKIAGRNISLRTVADAFVQLALQRYFEFGATALPANFSMFEVLNGGLKFDMSAIGGGQLGNVKGYQSLSGLLGLDTNRGLPGRPPVLPQTTNWYAQVGDADGGRLSASGTSDNELFWGGAAADQLRGGGGADLLIGGHGDDTYFYSPGDGADTIYDLNGQILVGGPGFRLAGGVASELPRTWRDDEHRVTYKMAGKDLVISGDGLGGGENTITVKNFIAAANDLGIELRRSPKVALVEGVLKNVFHEAGFVASNIAATIDEGRQKVISIALSTAALAGETIRLAVQNASGFDLGKLKFWDGATEHSFASGEVELTLAEGQTQVAIVLVEQGDIDTDAQLALTATLDDGNPDTESVTSNIVTLNLDAREEADPVTTTDIFGDRGFQTITTPDGTFVLVDEWGNPRVTDAPIPPSDDFRLDTPGNDKFLMGGGSGAGTVAFNGYGTDYVRAQRGGDDWIEQDGEGRMWAHAGAGNDLLIGGEGPNMFGQRQDMLNGGAGDDRIYGETRMSLEDAIEAGNTEEASTNPWEGDFLAGNSGDDLIIAGADRDLLAGGGGKDDLVGGAGDDVIFGDADYSAGDVRDLGWAGFGRGGMFWVEEGTPLDFTITVHNVHPGAVYAPVDSDADAIYAGNGDDLVLAGGGDDVVYGDAGDDRLHGDAGSDFLLGGAGDDLLVGEDTDTPVSEQGSDFLDGGDGNDLLLGGGGADAIYGGAGDDEVSGDSSGENAGDDYIDGEAGNDVLVGAGGADEIYGGEGDDLIGGDASNTDSSVHGDDYLDAEGGDDTVLGGGGHDAIFGGDGDDRLMGDSDDSAASVQGDDYLDGEAGDDEIVGNGGSDQIYGGEGDDQLFGEGADDPAGTAGDDYIDGGAGDDLLVGAGGNDYLVGGEGKDELFGESSDPDEEAGDDVLEGGAGADLLHGGGGADALFGEEGDDTLFGDAGNTADADMGDDVLDGGAGNDTVVGAGGSDRLIGGEGNDFLEGDGANIADALHGDDELAGGEGEDILIGGGGDDALDGGADADELQGGEGNDALSGGDGNDVLFGDAGNDTLDGGEGDDLLIGDEGDDVLEGGAGNDQLTGGAGTNTLSGGSGDDSYFFRRGDGFQRIVDSDGVDVLYLEPGLTIFDIQFSLGSLRITDGTPGDEIHIEGFDPNDALGTLAVEQLVFLGDNSTYDLAQLIQEQGFELAGTPQADTLVGTALNDAIQAFEDEDLVFAGDGDDLVEGGEGRDLVMGEGGNDELYGDAGDDAIDGGDGDDYLEGGEGADALAGGQGDDFYFASDTEDRIVENFDEGVDTVEATISYTLPDNVENLELLDNPYNTLTGTGNELNNVITGTSADTTYALYGLGGADLLQGHANGDLLDGGEGIDQMEGGEGDDVYVVDDEADLVVEDDLWNFGDPVTRGYDTVESSVSFNLPKFVEELHLAGDAEIDGGGNSENNYLAGNDAANVLVSTPLDGKNDNLASGIGAVTWLDFPGVFPTGADERVWDRVLRRYFEGEVTSDQIDSIGERIFVDARDGDVLDGMGGNDRLIGGWDDDSLFGGEGDDFMLGSGGRDTMEGGAGDDTYVVDRGFFHVFGYANSAGIQYEDYADDEIVEYADEGADTVWANVDWALGENFENLVLIDSFTPIEGVTPGDGLIAQHEAPVFGEGNEVANAITGNSRGNELFGYEGDDTLHGGRGDDLLDGGEGADTMYGGEHNDTYVVDDEGDAVIELGDAEGFDDWVQSSIDYTLGEFVENLELTGDFAVTGTGNELDNEILGNELGNVLTGHEGHDVIDGRGGDDEMIGGTGDDTYYTDSSGDAVVEGFDEGHDTVNSSESYELSDDLEDLYLLGENDIEGIGNELDNLIVGNSGANFLEGRAGIDTIEGNDGSDDIHGGEGDDVLSGGGWDDQLFGGEGNDSLDGGWGADWLEGGAGDETYFVDDDFDVVWENLDEGTDSVFERVFSYRTPDNVENATILGDFQDDPEFFTELYGNTLDNSLTGSDGFNYIDDDWGSIPGGGDDTIDGRAGGDTLFGRQGEDVIYGGDDAIRIEADYFEFDKEEGPWRESDGEDNDAVLLELEVLAQNHDNLYGGDAADDLDGGSGNDELYGEGGDDVLYGGDDGLTADAISGDGGEGGFELGDPVWLSNDDYLEGGEGDDHLDGGSGNDRLFGGDGADTLVGGADGPLNTSNRDFLSGGDSPTADAIDTMAGGTDDDEYYVDGFFVETLGTIISDCGDEIPNQVVRVWTTDIVIENDGEGDEDLVVAQADYTLTANVERLILDNQSAFALFGRGNELDNDISGNDNHNRLEGAGGNDSIYGGHGNDVLDGGEGDDELRGWTGNDKFLMRVGSGRDTVLFDGFFIDPGLDTVHVTEHLDASDITLSQHGSDLVIGINGTRDRMVVQDWFASSRGVNQIIFCDDPALDRAAIAALAEQRFINMEDETVELTEDGGVLVVTGDVLQNDESSDPASTLRVSNPGTIAGQYGELVLAENGEYTYTLNNDAVQWLSEGEVTGEGFGYQAEDEAQAFGDAALFINISGVNDAPVIVAADALGEVTEDAGRADYETDGDSLLVNGSFEDDFFGWELGGNVSFVDTDFIFFGPDFGIRYASFGAVGSPTLLSQALDTEEGERYLLRFYLSGDYDTDQGDVGVAQFSASWNGATLMTLGAVDLDDFEPFEFAVSGAEFSQLEFALQHDPDFWRLDAVELHRIVDEHVQVDDVQSAQGTLQFTDVDRFDAHFVEVTAPEDYLGGFEAFIEDDSSFERTGRVSWRFDVENEELDFLAEGDTLTQSYDVTVNDAFGGSAAQTVTVLIHGANDAPEAADLYNLIDEDTPSSSGNVFDEGGGFDVDQGTVLTIANADTYVGDWGTLVLNADGSYTYDLDNDAVQFLPDGESLFEEFEFTIVDDAAEPLDSGAILTIEILGVNDPVVTGPDFADVEEDAIFSASGNVLENDVDVDGETPPGGLWTPGDFTGFYGTLALAEDGSYEYLLDNDLEAVQRLHAGEVVTDTFTYEANDGDALSEGVLTVRITGANDGPLADPDAAEVQEDGVLVATGNALDNDFDLDHHTVLQVADPGSRFGAYGKLRLEADGSYTYTLKNSRVQFLGAGQSAVDTFTYTATDADPLDPLSAESIIEVTILGANDAPVTVKDVADVAEDGVLVADGNVLANDLDPDDLAELSVANAGTYTGNFGTLTLNGDGSYSYELANGSSLVQSLRAGQIVSDVFAYVASDGMAQTPGRLTVRIAGANDPSEAFADSATVREDLATVATGNVLVNDLDLDLGVLLEVSNPGTYALAHGTLVLTEQGGYTYSLDNAAAQPLDDGDLLTEVFTYTLEDGSSSTLTVSILGLNDSPDAVADFADVSEDGTLDASGNVLANDTDPDDGINAIVAGVHILTYGTLTLESDGDYFYELNNEALAVQSLRHGDTVTDVFAYSAVDDQVGTLSTLTVRVAGSNDAPITQNDAALTNEDALSVSGNVLANDRDVDRDTVLTVGNAGTFVHAFGTLVLGQDGAYAFTVNNAAAQSLAQGTSAHASFIYLADDGDVAEFPALPTNRTPGLLDIEIRGLNDAPTLANAIADQNADAGTPFSFTFAADTFADVDQNDVLTYTATLTDGSALPDWLEFDAATRTFTGTPPGGGGCDCNCEGESTDRLDIRVTATDLPGAAAFDEFALNIAGGGGGGGGMTIIGTDGNDVLVGTPCDDVIDGRKGFDKMSGGDGNDIYYVDKTCVPKQKGNEGVGNGEDPPPPGHDENQNDGPGTSPGNPGSQSGHGHDDDDGDDDHHHGNHQQCKVDEVIEEANHGYDIVYASADYALPANVEEVRLLGHADLDATGNALANVLVGNGGDNRLRGGLGADTYVYELHGGDDVVEETGPHADTLLLGEGISAGMVSLRRRQDDLVVEFAGTHDSVTVKEWFASSSRRVESIQFADGTAWNEEQIRSRVQRHFDEDCARPGHDRNYDDDRQRSSSYGKDDHDSRHRRDDEHARRGYTWGAGRERYDFEELHELAGRGGRAPSRNEVAQRWAAVWRYADALEGEADGASLPGQHDVARYSGLRWGFEGSTGAARGHEGLKTLEGIMEGFRKL
jgi:VCBS repeat-containing protein